MKLTLPFDAGTEFENSVQLDFPRPFLFAVLKSLDFLVDRTVGTGRQDMAPVAFRSLIYRAMEACASGSSCRLIFFVGKGRTFESSARWRLLAFQREETLARPQ